jgi:tetratricopeptide (TPR) repeat protein
VLTYEAVGIRHRVICAVAATFLVCLRSTTAGAQEAPQADRQFQSAVAHYEAGRFNEAIVQLEKLLQQMPESFDIHELLGLAYSATSQDSKANVHLQRAVALNPGSVPARTNLATNLVRLGKLESAEKEFKKAVELEPRNFDTNHNLAELYVRSGRVKDAVPFLEKAQQIDPSSYDNGYDLSLAYLMTGRLAEARHLIQALLQRKDTAELHNLLAEVEEKDGKFVEAATQYELAAHKDPSESNLFDWGSELLLHRTLDPAVEVFQHATERYPTSPRLMVGLGMALYSRGNYDEAVKALLKGADLNPSDPRCYYFLSKAYDSSPGQAEEVIERFRRFAELQPNNARASYYYAMSLWKGRRTQDPNLDLHKIETLLRTSIKLDSTLAEAHLQLGNLLSDQSKYSEAIPEYLRARELNPDLADVYYRLGQAYVRTGDKERGQEQLQIYQKLREQHLADLDRQRAEIRQFVYAEKEGSTAKQ